MDRRFKEYKHQLSLLNQRIARLEKRGYKFDVEDITKGGEKNPYYASQYYKSLRGNKLKDLAKVTAQDTLDNEEDFVPPADRDLPTTYSVIDEIETIINEFPDRVVVQMDVGNLGKEGERDYVDIGYVGNAMWDVWNETVMRASREDRIEELASYYESVEGELASLLNPYHNEAMYFYESEISNMLTQALRLLNWGVALSSEQMESLSPLYSNYENI